MRRYETIYIVRPDISEDGIAAITKRTDSILEKFSGTILRTDHWGIKKLAYPIKKELQGHYIYTEFCGLPAGVDEMERIFRIDDQVLKYMTIKTQEVYTPDAPKPESSKPLTSMDDDDGDVVYQP